MDQAALRDRPRNAGTYSPYKEMLKSKAPPQAFEAPLALGEGDAPEAQTPAQGVKEGIRSVGSYAPGPDDYTFEDVKKTYNYTIRPDGDIYFQNKIKGRSGLIPAQDTSPRAVKARQAILAMKDKVPKAMPAEKPDMALRGPAPGSTPDMSTADFDKTKGAR